MASRFSTGHALTIAGRHRSTLESIATTCLDSGAERVIILVQDMADGVGSLIRECGSTDFDVIINVASATSRVKDSDFAPSQLERYVMADLLVPIQFIQHLIRRSTRPLRLIFISSILAAVKAPDRLLYSSLKSLQEMCLRKLATQREGVQLLVVRVGTVIPHERSNSVAQKLANAIYDAYVLKKTDLNYGWSGWIYVALFYLQPIIFVLVVHLQRWLRVYLSGKR